ncbi:hypothetical protein Droror1_Dr00025187 [Drosera rotundifolia]
MFTRTAIEAPTLLRPQALSSNSLCLFSATGWVVKRRSLPVLDWRESFGISGHDQGGSLIRSLQEAGDFEGLREAVVEFVEGKAEPS